MRRQTNEYREQKLREHNNRQPTRREKDNAKADGYVLDDDWKTQFTIKAFGGVRHVNQKLKAVATQFRRDDGVLELQWERVSNVKKFDETALREYCAFVKREENLNLLPAQHVLRKEASQRLKSLAFLIMNVLNGV